MGFKKSIDDLLYTSKALIIREQVVYYTTGKVYLMSVFCQF